LTSPEQKPNTRRPANQKQRGPLAEPPTQRNVSGPLHPTLLLLDARHKRPSTGTDRLKNATGDGALGPGQHSANKRRTGKAPTDGQRPTSRRRTSNDAATSNPAAKQPTPLKPPVETTNKLQRSATEALSTCIANTTDASTIFLGDGSCVDTADLATQLAVQLRMRTLGIALDRPELHVDEAFIESAYKLWGGHQELLQVRFHTEPATAFAILASGVGQAAAGLGLSLEAGSPVRVWEQSGREWLVEQRHAATSANVSGSDTAPYRTSPRGQDMHEPGRCSTPPDTTLDGRPGNSKSFGNPGLPEGTVRATNQTGSHGHI
jgi:hypothetical protein